MSNVIGIANEIAASLADHHAEVQFIPEFKIRDAGDTRVVVVPAGTEFRALSRAVHEERPCVHVGFVRKATEDDVPALVDFVQALGKSFLNRRFGNALCTGAVFDPIYSPAHLREKGLFVSVVELTFRTAE